MIPNEGEIAGPVTGGGFRYSSDTGGTLNYSIFAPLRTTEKGLWLYDLGIGTTFDNGFDLNAISAKAGLVYRYRQGENQVFGFNGYIEAAKAESIDQTFGLFSFGVEYERRPNGGDSFVQAGANYYFPFDDYTDRAKFGTLSSAPREGIDGYISFGRDFEGYSIRGSLEAFSYLETDNAFDLSGYNVGLDIAYWERLPKGMTATASIGIRYDSRANVDPSLQAGLSIDYLFGNSAGKTVSTHGCAVVRNGVGIGRVNCDESVVAAMGAQIVTKPGDVIVDDRQRLRAVRLTAPRRNLGFGSIMTPIEYRNTGTSTIRLQVNATGGDDTFGFTSNVDGLPISITTSGGTAMTSRVSISDGSYTISETDVPTGWSLDSASCTGATSTSSTASGAQFTVAEGDAVVCTFNNSLGGTAALATAIGTISGGTLTTSDTVRNF